MAGSCRITPRRRFCSAIPKDNKMLKIKNKQKSMVTTLSPANNSLLVLRLLRLISRNLYRGCRSCLNNLPARWQFFNLGRESRENQGKRLKLSHMEMECQFSFSSLCLTDETCEGWRNLIYFPLLFPPTAYNWTSRCCFCFVTSGTRVPSHMRSSYLIKDRILWN